MRLTRSISLWRLPRFVVLDTHWCLAVAVSAMFSCGMYGSASICRWRNMTANGSACMFVMRENWWV